MNDVIVYETGARLYLNITNRCPCDCVFCIRKKANGINIGESLWLAKEPSFEEIIAATENKDVGSYDEIVICGYGEPTERFELLPIIAKYIKGKYPGSKIRLNTNGLSDLINGKPTAKDLSAYIDAVSISLNASNKNDYFNVCRPAFGEKSFDALLSFAGDCKKHFSDTCFTVTDMLSSSELSSCKNLCEKLGIRLRVRQSL